MPPNAERSSGARQSPLQQRVVAFYFNAFDDDTLKVKADRWKTQISQEFPRHHTKTHWKVNVKARKYGIPVFETEQPVAEFYHFYLSRENKRDHIVKQIQFRKDRIAFHHIRSSALCEISSFDDLLEMSENILPQWQQEIKKTLFTGVSVEYVNRINSEFTPAFMGEKGEIKLGQTIRAFSDACVGTYRALTQPLMLEMTMDYHDPVDITGHLKVNPVDAGETSIGLRNSASHISASERYTLPEAMEIAKQCHEKAHEIFVNCFTDSAKEQICL